MHLNHSWSGLSELSNLAVITFHSNDSVVLSIISAQHFEKVILKAILVPPQLKIPKLIRTQMHMHSHISAEYHNLFCHIFIQSACVPTLLVIWYTYIYFQTLEGLSYWHQSSLVGTDNSLESGRVLLCSHLYLLCSYTLYSCLTKLLPRAGDWTRWAFWPRKVFLFVLHWF